MLDADYWSTWDTDERLSLALQIAFCLAVGRVGDPWDEANEKATGLHNSNVMHMIEHRYRTIFAGTPFGQNIVKDEIVNDTRGAQLVNLLLIARFACIIKHVKVYPNWDRDDPPSCHLIPLATPSFRDIPIPDGKQAESGQGVARSMSNFETTLSWQYWVLESIETAVATITESEWVGWTFFVLALELKIEDPTGPFRNIRFTATPDHSNPDQTFLEARDCVNPQSLSSTTPRFHLKGYMRRSSGSIMLAKSDSNGEKTTEMFGVLTPLGIAGFCQKPGGGLDQYFWLYRKEWIPPNPGSYVSPLRITHLHRKCQEGEGSEGR